MFWVFCGAAISAFAAESKPAWQAGMGADGKGCEDEGQLTVYIAGYGAVIDSGCFRKRIRK
jgi:hypothetical protein